jgi:hypothetical protein
MSAVQGRLRQPLYGIFSEEAILIHLPLLPYFVIECSGAICYPRIEGSDHGAQR